MKLLKCCKDYLETAKLLIFLAFLLVANSNYSQNKNPYIVQADKTFKNEALNFRFSTWNRIRK